MSIDPKELRGLADDIDLVKAVHLEIENRLVEMRDSGMMVPNRNGLAILDKDGKSNGIIRIGTGWAIQMIIGRLADELSARTGETEGAEE